LSLFRTEAKLIHSFVIPTTEESQRFLNRNFSYGYDVNSLYPKAMVGRMPVGTPVYQHNIGLEELLDESYVWFVKATVEVLPGKYPPVPLKDKRLMHPCGVFTSYFVGDELLDSVRHGECKIREIHGGYRFAASENVFKDC
jgi:hypothetical protein